MTRHQPLLALDAIVFDTETTGLDASEARLLQFGAVHIEAGTLAATRFECKVNPSVAIPPASTKIHGLTAESLAGAPTFPEAYARFCGFAETRVLIGHNVGFDLAILQRECKLAGLKPPQNRMLDTRLLAELCFPRLAGFTLDALASHLGLTISGRHDALADAELTAKLFLALIPRLKERNIRTLAEAETACKSLTNVLDNYARVGWVEPVAGQSAESALSRIDAYPFRHRVKDIASMPPLVMPADASLGGATALMATKGISSVFVSLPDAGEIGIITERDIIRLIGTKGPGVLDNTIGALASRPLLTVPADAFIYRAIGRMERRNVRHLGVVDETGALVGALSARDLLRLRSSDALALGDAIDTSQSIADLAKAWGRLSGVVARLVAEGVSAAECAGVIAREIGALTRRAAIEAEKRLAERGQGAPPAPYAVLVLGSGGRGESLLVPDQDNAIIHAGEPGDDAFFLALGHEMNEVLDDIGIPLCKGGVMARNPAWNGNAEAWRSRIISWTETVTPEDLLSVDIFFDFRAVHGDMALAQGLASEARAIAAKARAMVKLLADQMKSWSPPIGMFGRLITEEGRMDLKKGGLFPIVASARCLALSHALPARSTRERLAALRQAGIGADRDLAAFEKALETLMELILAQQLADIAAGLPPSTKVNVTSLDAERREALKEALRSLSAASDMVHDLLFSGVSPT
ncbi:MAG: CBS domain-containing protein [Rhizobiales bacterium]|nr:CBS domain-containing protein [Hyphomicrobiales bacterium]